ncbi:CLUMA_CG008567, isoform A [Clunio marinus]|uniref:CLUMA_CG008567, isoform A n=1 Tax=Clunio marinus TaxID=568069 RepID=A0A1J1I9I0_9DIPT|nr:CLUMA_CG008567, isoform A [Clunio marinus]
MSFSFLFFNKQNFPLYTFGKSMEKRFIMRNHSEDEISFHKSKCLCRIRTTKCLFTKIIYNKKKKN